MTTFACKLFQCFFPEVRNPSFSFELIAFFSVSDPFSLEKCISIIRQLDEDREGWLAPFPWSEEFQFSLDNIYTRLKFVTRKKERGLKADAGVDMFQIFVTRLHTTGPRNEKVASHFLMLCLCCY